MKIKALLMLVALAAALGMQGCSSLTAGDFLNADHPGTVRVAGGTMQLLVANPEYTDLSDKMVRDDYLLNQAYGKHSNSMAFDGGIGVMEIWQF